MAAPAIIAGTLVDVRNVGTHKSVKLTIHVPEEYATKVVAAFGWPTGVNPVSVAIARLVESQEQQVRSEPPRQVKAPSQPAGVAKERRAFSDMAPAQQAGMLCQERAFRLFLAEKFEMEIPDPDEAAALVRDQCGVKSRSEITKDNAYWSSMVLAYRLWQNEPSVVPA